MTIQAASTWPGLIPALRDIRRIAGSMGILKPGLLLSGVVLNLLGMALPLAMLQIFDRIIPHAAFQTLTMIVLGLTAALIGEGVLRQVRSAMTAWEGARFDHRTSVALVGQILDTPVQDVEAQAVGTHLDRLNSVEPVRDFYGQQVSLLLADLPFMLIFLALIAYIGGFLVLAPLGLVILYSALAWVTGQSLHATLKERKELDDRRYNFIVEVLSSIHTAKGLAMERVLQRRYERLIAAGAARGWRINYLSSISDSFASGFSQLTTITVGGFGALLVINGAMSVGALAASTMLAGRSVQPLLRILGLWTRYQSVRLSVDRLKAIRAMPRELVNEGAVLGPIESLKLENISFRYGAGGPLLFEKLDLSLRRGETIGISGPNGCGKTTLLGLMMSSYRQNDGSITINGLPLDEIMRPSLRGQIAYIPQRAVLFKGTILENLTKFDVDRHLEQALALAAQLGLDRFFAAMPDGYDMQVGNGATGGLPSGVVQRIGMVRALVGEPRLILFDEANSALDHEGDRLVRDTLMAYKPTTAIALVSFRPSLLAIADRRFVFRDRRLVQVDAEPALKPRAFA